MVSYISSSRTFLVPIEFSVVEIFSFRFSRKIKKFSHFSQLIKLLVLPCHPIRNCSQNSLHHGQVFTIVMRLEERDSQVELEHDAADGPDVTRLRPAQFKDDFRGPVVPCGHNRAVVLVIKGGASEVDESRFGVFDATNFSVLEINDRLKYHFVVTQGCHSPFGY